LDVRSVRREHGAPAPEPDVGEDLQSDAVRTPVPSSAGAAAIAAKVPTTAEPARRNAKRRNAIVPARPPQILHVVVETRGTSFEAVIAKDGDFGISENPDRRDLVVDAWRYLCRAGSKTGAEVAAAEVDVLEKARPGLRNRSATPPRFPVPVAKPVAGVTASGQPGADAKGRDAIVPARPPQILHVIVETPRRSLKAIVTKHGDIGVPENPD
jgi:hypothetical protein